MGGMQAKSIVRRILCWPLYLGLVPALFVHLFWGERYWWADGVYFTVLKRDSWPMRSWYAAWGGTCFGYAVMLAPDQAQTVTDHELVHIEQLEAAAVAGVYMGAVSAALAHSSWSLPIFFTAWVACGWCAYGGASLVAWLRSEPNAYRGNHLEEAAYNATKVKCTHASA